ncbi:MAG: hypothetical protein BMS9Abin37_2064 [Acidobacteriota bacterium]|nr:MAG: hypothetical protein BMS9Abin37_2064 [Acidobacteriota bacterium]
MRRVLALSVLVFLMPTGVFAQEEAWVPPKGEFFWSVRYQWYKADDHLLSSDVLEPELTPFEELMGIDFDSTANDFGKMESQVIIMDGDIGITDKLALSGGLAFVQSKYTQSGLGSAEGPQDDGTFNGNFQDARIGVRYLALNGTWVLTPSATFVLPLTDYPIMGHSAIGRGLKELQLGVNFGRLLNIGGMPSAYIQGSYAYTIMENIDVVGLDRSNLVLSGGYFHRAITVQVFGSWQKIHGGIDWAHDIRVRQNLGEIIETHDQAAATRDFQVGGGVSFQVSEAADLFVALNNTLWGANTYKGRTLSFGMTYGFQAFGGIGTPRVPYGDRDGDDDNQ